MRSSVDALQSDASYWCWGRHLTDGGNGVFPALQRTLVETFLRKMARQKNMVPGRTSAFQKEPFFTKSVLRSNQRRRNRPVWTVRFILWDLKIIVIVP